MDVPGLERKKSPIAGIHHTSYVMSLTTEQTGLWQSPT
jgi:hypothetical protein